MFYVDGIGSEEKVHYAFLWPSLPRTLWSWGLCPAPSLRVNVCSGLGGRYGFIRIAGKICYKERPLHSEVSFQLRSASCVSLI